MMLEAVEDCLPAFSLLFYGVGLFAVERDADIHSGRVFRELDLGGPIAKGTLTKASDRAQAIAAAIALHVGLPVGSLSPRPESRSCDTDSRG